MVRGEGARGGSAGNLLHHGGFDFEVAAVVEKVADGAEDGCALDEDLADVAGSSGSEVGVSVAERVIGGGGGGGVAPLRHSSGQVRFFLGVVACGWGGVRAPVFMKRST